MTKRYLLGCALSVFVGLTRLAGADVPGAPVDEPRASAAPKFTLSEALLLMEKTHPLLTASEEEVHAVSQDAVAAGLWTNPVVTASYANAWNSSYDRLGLIGGSVSQFVEVAGAPAARRRVFELLSESLVHERDALRRELGFRLQEAAIDYAQASTIVELLRDYRTRVTETVRIVETRVATGAVPRYDADRIALVDSAAEADLAAAEASLAMAEATLRAAVGPEGTRLVGQLDYRLEREPILPALSELVKYLHEQRPDVRAAALRVESSQASIEAAKKSILPGFAVSLGAQFGQGPGQFDLGGALTIPLPLLDHGQGKVDAAIARAEKSASELRAIVGPAEQLLVGAYAETEKRRGAAKTYLGRIDVRRDAMLLEAQAGYQGGKLSVLELADAYSSWRDSRLRGLAVCAEARRAEVALARIAGLPLRKWLPDLMEAKR